MAERKGVKQPVGLGNSYIGRYQSDPDDLVSANMIHMAEYLKYFLGYDSRSVDPKDAAVRDSFVFLEEIRKQLTTGSVISEPSIVETDKLDHELRAVIASAEKFTDSFDNMLSRVSRHTELCKSLRNLREAVKPEPKSSFFRAIVDIHDCTRSITPEDMTSDMAKAILKAVKKLTISMTDQELFNINEELFSTGLRVWARPREKPRRECSYVEESTGGA